jgi:hypothetical protein
MTHMLAKAGQKPRKTSIGGTNQGVCTTQKFECSQDSASRYSIKESTTRSVTCTDPTQGEKRRSNQRAHS